MVLCWISHAGDYNWHRGPGTNFADCPRSGEMVTNRSQDSTSTKLQATGTSHIMVGSRTRTADGAIRTMH